MSPHHHDHDHDHDHDHSHDPISTGDEPPAAARVRALEVLLVEKGVVNLEDVRTRIDWLVSRSPADGARLVARAWIDPGFKKQTRRRCTRCGARARPRSWAIAGRRRSRKHPKSAPPGRVHALLLLPEGAARPTAGLVQEPAVPVARRLRPARSTDRVRRSAGRRRGATRRRLDRRHPLPRDPSTSRRNGGHERGRAGRTRLPRLDDRRRPAGDTSATGGVALGGSTPL